MKSVFKSASAFFKMLGAKRSVLDCSLMGSVNCGHPPKLRVENLSWLNASWQDVEIPEADLK